jgi:hypothetical protein
MSTMTVPESRARLGYLLSEMLSLPHLPEDLHQAVTGHLQQQLASINLFKPEYCLRLYPVLAELAELEARSEAAPVEAMEFFAETPAEEAVPEAVAETVMEETAAEIPVEAVAEESAPETPAETVAAQATAEAPVEPVAEQSAPEISLETVAEQSAPETDEPAENAVENLPMAAIAGSAEAAANSRTLW